MVPFPSARPGPLLFILSLVIAALLAPSPAHAQDTPVAFTNARILPVDAPPIDRGTIIIHRGKILALGDIPTPDNATIIDATGHTIIPGLVDTHSHIGGVAGADNANPIQPDVRILDAVNPLDPGFRRALAGGLTTLNIMPGSGHLLSGQTLYVKLRRATNIEDLALRDDQGRPLGGIKMANGTNSLREPPFPGTRAKSAALVRDRFIKAQEYKAARDKARADNTPDKAPPRDLGLEVLVEALEGSRIIHHHTHRADDILTVLRLQREFGFRVVLHHVSEAWKVADEIAKAQKDSGGKVIGCSVIYVDSPGGKLEAAELLPATSGVLERAGAQFSLHTDDWITDSRWFLRSAAMCVRAGASRDAMLRALTLSGAEQMDLAHRLGSLTPGKDADLVVLSGDPFALRTLVLATWVDGVQVFDRNNPEDRLYATGGFGAGREQEPYLCCYGNWFTFGGKQWGTSGN